MYRFTIFTALAATLLIAPTASAEDAPEDVVKYRALQMSAMGRHMGTTKLILKGNISRPEDLNGHAAALHSLGLNLEALFPENTKPNDKLETEALPSVWENPEGFKKAVKAYNDATANFVEVAKTGDLKKGLEAYGKVGQSCGGCHDDFRVDD